MRIFLALSAYTFDHRDTFLGNPQKSYLARVDSVLGLQLKWKDPSVQFANGSSSFRGQGQSQEKAENNACLLRNIHIIPYYVYRKDQLPKEAEG